MSYNLIIVVFYTLLCTRLFVKNVGVVDVVVKKFYEFAVFFIFLSVSDETVGVCCRRETAGPGWQCQVAGPHWRGRGEVGGHGRRRHHLHHLHRQPRQGQGGGAGHCVLSGPGAEWHHSTRGRELITSGSPSVGPLHISLTFTRANISAQVEYFSSKYSS